MRWLVWLLAAACPAADLVIRDITLIDVAGGQAPRVGSVWISGDRVQAIGKSVKAPKSAEILDGKGKYLIPGLWDSHFHLIRESTRSNARATLNKLVAFGITGVRDMGSIPEEIVALRKEIREGRVAGPDLFVAGAMIDGPPSKADGTMLVVQTADEARTEVDRMAALGVDFIKVQQNLSAELYRAIMERAALRKLPVMGHTPDAIPVSDIVRGGQKTLEHLTGVLVSCAGKEAEIRGLIGKGAPVIDFGPMGAAGQLALESFDAARALRLYAELRGVHVAPTLVWERSYTFREQSVKRRRPETQAMMQTYYAKAMEIISAMHRAGVPLLAGTDGGDDFTEPGAGLHEEMRLLVEAGITPLDALRSATLIPAKLFGVEHDRADFVILSANPLQDIRNTRRIDAVILRGRVWKAATAVP